MRRDRQYLEDIIASIDWITARLTGVTFESYFRDPTLQAAVLYHLIVIGEAASRLSADLRNSAPGVPWADIVGFRNRAVHAYFGTDLRIVWDAATQDIRELRPQVQSPADGLASLQ